MEKNEVCDRIFAIENRKKNQHLAHELGAGLPCEKCKDKCSGFDLHYWRKICKNCKCGKKEHGVIEDDDVGMCRIGKLFGTDSLYKKKTTNICQEFNKNLSITGANHDDDTNKNMAKPSAIAFDWIPADTDSTVFEKYINHLPKNHQPISGTSGACHRKRLIELQLPIHDLDADRCHELSPREIKLMNDFITNCKKHVGIGTIVENGDDLNANCLNCNAHFIADDVHVTTKNDNRWHPACFTCSRCNDRLADLIYFVQNDQLYCGRHFAELSYDRCAACDELIFTKQYTKAEGKVWHIKHFCCYDCDKPLAGLEYIASDDCHPHCIDCSAQKCSFCCLPIAVDARRVSYQNFNWHASDICFKCASCDTSLIGKLFLVKNSSIFCSAACKVTMFPN